jgi:hypothetical protein
MALPDFQTAPPVLRVSDYASVSHISKSPSFGGKDARLQDFYV